MCPIDLDLSPIFPKIGSRDTEGVLNMCLFGSLQTFSFLKYSSVIADLVARG